MTAVVIADTTQGLVPALDAIFAPYGGGEGVIPRHDGTTVYVKPNSA
jgi:hypothetical protein